ncbi:methyl-accepting chemotaxis protein [Paraburkholderia sediminicola]|uniref:methyl-accepting chemotaxis protein n=1 Tax=Paraburkholderia sediminicola TaxID=458836 RepID=UPI001583714C|nr:methyl-accepting chemotaxis protein [Paraburkholderia sediminicola]
MQWTIAALSAIGAVAATRWYGSYGAVLGLVQFLVIFGLFGAGLIHAISTLRAQLNALCDGDLVQDVSLPGRDELAALGEQARLLAYQLSQVVARIRSEAELIAMGGAQATQHATLLSQRTESQAASLEQTRASLQALLEAVRYNSDQTQQADEGSARAHADAVAGQAAVRASVESIERIEQRSHEMGEILSVIDGIAFQTNILALNAAVEAARAGDSGRGFAVVAAEVRALAQRSAQAAAEVKKLIQHSRDEVSDGVQAIEGSRNLLTRAVDAVSKVAALLRDIARSSSEQTTGLQEIAQAVEVLDDITHSNGQMVGGSVETASLLQARADRLSDGVKYIRLRQGCANEARAMAERAAALVDIEGPENAVRQFHDPKGGFRDRDLYIVVADRDDYFRAFGSDPSKAGKLRKEALPGDDQSAIREASWRAVEQGGGWIEFNGRHPVTRQPVEKIGYIAPALGGRWAVQCSVNRGDGLKPITSA